MINLEKSLLKSKAVWGSILVAAGGLITLVGQMISGTLDFNSFLTQVIPQLGTALGIFGIRFAMK